MEFDRSGSTIFRVRLNAKEQKAFDTEARRILAEHASLSGKDRPP